jgi:hypothetical protein
VSSLVALATVENQMLVDLGKILIKQLPEN